MENILTFNKTVRGHNHVLKDTVCEDFSASYVAEEHNYKIAVVADGHGDSACFRSQIGSRLAVEITANCLKEFAEASIKENSHIINEINQPSLRNSLMRQLTNAIVSKWYDAALEDISKQPIEEENLNDIGKYAEKYRNGENLTHIYGTTMIAALQFSDYLILIQQGDGRCDVFYSNGNVAQPIPWDARCQGNITTSMCDEDVANGIRWTIIDLDEEDVVACYLGTDGVEDSFINNEETQEGTHYFYRKMSCIIMDEIDNDIDGYLETYLSEFSANGSGDDISVAGIVNVDQLILLRNDFEEKMKRYVLDSDFLKVDKKIISMSRRHGSLKNNLAKSNEMVEKAEFAFKECEELIEKISFKINTLEEAIEAKKTEIEEKEREHNELIQFIDEKENDDPVSDEFYNKLKSLSSGVFATQIKGMMTSWFDRDEKELRELENNLAVEKENLIEARNAKLKTENDLFGASENYQSSLNEFNEFDEKYIRLLNEREEIQKAICNLDEIEVSE